MSHQTPATIFNNAGPANFIVHTDAGSISVSGILYLLGVNQIATTASGNTVLIMSTGSFAPTTFVANSGTASADVNSVIQFHGDGSFIKTTATGNTLFLNVQQSPLSIGGTGRTFLTTNSVLFGQGTAPVGLTKPALDGQILLGATSGPPQFATVTSSGNTLVFMRGPNSLNIDVNFFGSTLFNPLSPDNGGTGRTIFTSHGVLIGGGTGPIQTTNVGTDGQALIASSTGAPKFNRITSSGGTLTFIFGPNALNIDTTLLNSTLFNPLIVPNGGTGRTVLTSYGVLIGEGSLAIRATPPGADGQALIASSAGDPKFASITSSGGTITFIYGPNALNMEFIYPQTFTIPLNVPSGGTGRSVLTTYGVLVGAGTAPVHVTAPGTDGQTLIAANAADPKFMTITSTGNSVIFTAAPNALNLEVNPLGITFTTKVPVADGGTGKTLFTAYSVLVGQGSLGIFAIPPGTNGQVLIASSTGNPRFSTITSTGNTLTFKRSYNLLNIEATLSNNSFFNPLIVPNGGTGKTIFTAFTVLLGEGSKPVGMTNVGTNGQVLIASSTGDPRFARLTSSSHTLTFVFGYNALNIDVVNIFNLQIIANTGSASPQSNTFFFLGSPGLTTSGAGSTITIQIDSNNYTFFNPIPVPNGGTGITLLTQFGVLIGEGSNDIHVTTAGTDGQILLAATNADPAFNTVTSTGNTLTFIAGPNSLNIDVNFSNATLFNPLIVPNGGTGNSILTLYGVLLGEGSLPINATAPGTDGQALIASSSGDPAFMAISSSGNTLLFTAGPNALNIDVNIAGITLFNPIIVPNGGLGNSLLTMFAVLFGEGSLPVGATNAGTDGQLLIAASSAAPAFATMSSTGNSIAFTPEPNALNLETNLSGWVLFNPLPVQNGGTGITLLTVFGVLIGEGSRDINVTDPGTDGQLLLASSTGDPAFNTVTSTGNTILFSAGNNSLNMDVSLTSSALDPLPVPNGGTTDTSFTPYAIICGGTTGTAPFQDIGFVGNPGEILMSNGPGALPSFQSSSGGGELTSITTQKFTSNSTYVPSFGMVYCTIECIGAGGGGGGAANDATTYGLAAAGGGGGGGYVRFTVPAASIGVSQSVTVGIGGSGGSNSGGNGVAGGASSVGALASASGGAGGTGSPGGVTWQAVANGGVAGIGSGGQINAGGQPGASGYIVVDEIAADEWSLAFPGAGGNSIYGAGAFSVASPTVNSGLAGQNGRLYGGGGSGAYVMFSTSTGFSGGMGANGIVLITEYL